MIKLIIYGKVETKKYVLARNKIRRKNETKIFEYIIGYKAKEYMRKNNLKIIEGIVFLKIIGFIFTSNLKKDGKYCDKKPDCTNIQKSVEDALKNICFRDDAKVVDIHTCKFWCVRKENERVEIFIKKI